MLAATTNTNISARYNSWLFSDILSYIFISFLQHQMEGDQLECLAIVAEPLGDGRASGKFLSRLQLCLFLQESPD